MDEELVSEWFAKGESLGDTEEANVDPDDTPVPNLRARFRLPFLALGLGAAIFLFVAAVASG